MHKGFFITGTDTGIGKTRVTLALMHYFQQQDKTVLGMKPIASGCQTLEGRLKNEDALLLQQYGSFPVAYGLINPYAFALPAAPHIAAGFTGQSIDLTTIYSAFRKLQDLAQWVMVEGVGGWQVPLNSTQSVKDLAAGLALPVIIVVGIRLGCINHALLTFRAVLDAKVPCAGWIASCIEENMLFTEENIATIQQLAKLPLLGVLPFKQQMGVANFTEQLELTNLKIV